MRITKDIPLRKFEAWSGGAYTLQAVIDAAQCDTLEFIIDDLYPDGMDATQLNDFLWFQRDQIYEWLDMPGDDEDNEFAEPQVWTDFTSYCDQFEVCNECPFDEIAADSYNCRELWKTKYGHCTNIGGKL